MGRNQLAALLDRTGFAINTFDVLSFDASFPKDDNDPEGGKVEVKENFYCIVATKQRPLDIK